MRQLAHRGPLRSAEAGSADGKHFLVFQHHMLISVRAHCESACMANVCVFYSSILISILRLLFGELETLV